MVPWTTNRIPHHQTRCERSTIVSAVAANGEEFISATGEYHFFAVGLSRYHAAVAELAKRKSILEINFVRLWYLCHDLLLR